MATADFGSPALPASLVIREDGAWRGASQALGRAFDGIAPKSG